LLIDWDLIGWHFPLVIKWLHKILMNALAAAAVRFCHCYPLAHRCQKQL